MPFMVHVLHIDFIDTQGTKHAIMKQAEVELAVSGSTVGYDIEIRRNGTLIATLSEGVHWTNAVSNALNAEAISKVINNLGLTGQLALLSSFTRGSATARVFAKMIGRGGTGYQLTARHDGAAEIDLAGLLAAETVTFDSTGAAGYGPITLTEGIDFTDAATLAAAINANVTLSPLMTAGFTGTVVQVLDDGGFTTDAALLTALGVLADTVTGDSWHELNGGPATTQFRVVSGDITFDGAAAASLRDYTYDGRGPAAEVFQNWLNDNVPPIGVGVGDRLDGSLKVEFVPIPEGTQVTVVWEEG